MNLYGAKQMKTAVICSYFLLCTFTSVAVQESEIAESKTSESNIEQSKSDKKAKLEKVAPTVTDSINKSTVGNSELPPDTTANNKQTPEFIPSEAISEDLDVSFPVDI